MQRRKKEWNINMAMERKEAFVFRTKETGVKDYEIVIRNGKIISIEENAGTVNVILFEEKNRENPQYDERVRISLYAFAKKDITNFKELYSLLAKYDKYYFELAKQIIIEIQKEYEKIGKMQE